MVGIEDRQALRRTGIRGRVAFALMCIESALAALGIEDDRLAELVAALWQFVEQSDLSRADQAWRPTRVVVEEVLDAVERGLPVPKAYRHVPPFVLRALNDTVDLATACLYEAMNHTCEQEAFELTVRVAESCARNGIPLPPIARFAHVAIGEDDGWGMPTPRTRFLSD